MAVSPKPATQRAAPKAQRAGGDFSSLFLEMLRIRVIERRISERYKEQEMRCPVHLSIGQEAVAVGVCAHLEKTDKAGLISGRDVDKFATLALTPVKAQRVAAPLIAECPVNIECVVRHSLHLGSHEMFVGEIVAVHADESVLDANEEIDFVKAAPFCFNLGDYWSLKEKVGSYGYTKK